MTMLCTAGNVLICNRRLQDDEAIGADASSIRSKFLEVHNDCVKKTQEYDAMYAEHARISQVNSVFLLWK